MTMRHTPGVRTLPGRGFTLVELLVALLLGVVLSVGMAAAYIGAQQNAFYEDQLARVQENGRFALRLLTRELAMAGFFAGAPGLSGVATEAVGRDCGEGNWVLDGSTPMDFVGDHSGEPVPESVAGASLNCLDGGDIPMGVDLLVIKRTAGEPSLAGGAVAQRLTSSWVRGWYLRLADGAPVGWERQAPADLRGLASELSPDSYWRAITKVFFIRKYSDSANRDDGIPTLCMETMSGNAMAARCMVEGIEDMQYEFGLDTDADGVPERYSNSPTAEEMASAVTVRVYLLVRSIRTVSGWVDEKTYSLGRKVVTARRDGYLRRVFSSTVLLRNLGRPG
jgi:prepilin-type N-terminal cleavage/methylation domain-containing protein